MVWRFLFLLQLQPPVTLSFLFLLSHSLFFLLFITVPRLTAPDGVDHREDEEEEEESQYGPQPH